MKVISKLPASSAQWPLSSHVFSLLGPFSKKSLQVLGAQYSSQTEDCTSHPLDSES